MGAAVAAFFLASAAVSIPGGRFAERVGAKRGMSIAAVGTTLSLLGTGAAATVWWHILLFLVLGGISMGLSASAANLSLARLIPRHRHGVAFGFSKAAGPAATLLAGSAVPLVALTIGWRWAFVLATIGIGLFFLVVPDDVSRGTVPRDGSRQKGQPRKAVSRPLIVLAVASGFGVGAANSMGAFFIESAIQSGYDPGFAGVALAIGSLSGVTARVLWGWIADRRQGGRLRIVELLMFVGGITMLSFGYVESEWALVGLAILVFAAAWGWTGLFIFAVVRISPEAPAAATGITAAGTFVGATIGPVAFGVLAQTVSYRAMWLFGAVALTAAGVLVEAGRRSLRRSRESALA